MPSFRIWEDGPPVYETDAGTWRVQRTGKIYPTEVAAIIAWVDLLVKEAGREVA